MFSKSSKTKMCENSDENIDDDINQRNRAQSTSHLLTPDSAIPKTILPTILPRQDRSPTPSTTSSTSSIAPGNSPKTNLTSFLKISSPLHKTNGTPSHEEGFVMTIIRSPSTSSQRTQSTEPTTPIVINDESANNNKFFKNKVTAALNHMKYRQFKYLFMF